MKTLHLCRHAKSSWDQPGVSDRDRPLNKRGKRDAPRMGAALRQLIAPVSVSVSPARRAQLTLGGLCDAWPALGRQRHTTEEDLYTFAALDLADWIREQDDARPELFIIGHNPALTDLANLLDPAAGLGNIPTAGYVRLALDIDQWRDLHPGCGRTECTLFPKQL